jgi:hypothetical protein
MAIVKNKPSSITESIIIDFSFSRFLLLFSHRYVVTWVLLLLLGKLIDITSRICTSREQVENWSVGQRLFPNFCDLISNWLCEVISKSLLDKLIT